MIRTLLTTSLVLGLSGCTAIGYKNTLVDSAPPPDADKLVRCPATLAKGASCTARVQADQWTSPTGIQVKKEGERYCVLVLPNQVWFDKTRRNIPPHGEDGNWLMRLAPKRHPTAGFFSLMVNVAGDSAKDETAAAVSVLAGGPFVTPSRGELVLYPNDAIGPSSDPIWYYRNNAGYIWVKVTRCE